MMKLFEKTKSENTDIPSAISSLLKSQFSIDISPEDIRNSVENMSLSDMLEMDTAISNKNLNQVENILKTRMQLEYEMPNRGSLQSRANVNPTPPKNNTSMVPSSEKQDIDQQNNPDDKKDQSDTNTGTIKSSNPEEYKDQKDIDNAKEEIEKLKKVAGIK